MLDAERQHLLAQLVHADEELRRLAVERTSLLRPEEALPLLAERLGDASWRVRKAAIARMAALPESAGAVPTLLEAIADGANPGRRNAALEALVACGRSATSQLLQALDSRDVDVRKQVVDVLGAIRDPRSEAGLARALADSDPNVRAAAADAIATLPGRSALAALQQLAAGDAHGIVRSAALRALVGLGAAIPPETIASALAEPLLAADAYAALGQSELPGALDTALKGLLAPRASVRAAAGRAVVALAARSDGSVESLRAFAAAHPEVANEVIARIGDGAARDRLAAVQLAALLRAPEAAGALAHCGSDPAVADAARAALAALGDELPISLALAWPKLAPADRAFVCSALEACGASAPAQRLLCRALDDPSSEVRAAAARALGAVGSATAFGELFACAARRDPNASVESAEAEDDALVAAIVAVAEREGSEAVAAAISLIETRLARGAERARLAGARLLARLARRADAVRVRRLLADPSELVRASAVEAVARLGPAGEEALSIALADEACAVRSASARAVVRLGFPSADADLEALAQDRHPRVRSAAMSALAERAVVPGARARVLGLLAAGVSSGGIVALAALEALRRIGGQDAAAIAASGLRSPEPEIAEAAAACIGEHGGEALSGELIALIAHPAWSVRARAARGLAAQRAVAAVPHLYARLGEERDEFARDALLAALAALES